MLIDVDGVRTFVGQGGLTGTPDGDGSLWRGGATPRLLMLHGAGMDRTVWVLLARYFARHGVDVIVPDLPAHGASAGAPLQNIDAMAAWSERLMSELVAHHGLGDGPLLIAGHSMGSFVALALGARLSDAGSPPVGLLLLGSGYPMPVGPPLLQAADTDLAVAADMITIWGHAYASRLGHNTVPGISVANSSRVLLLRGRPGTLHADLAACNAWADGERVAGSLDGVPVDLLLGDEDRMTPAAGSRALAELLNARTHSIARSGHMMMAEQPERVLEVLRTVVRERFDGQ